MNPTAILYSALSWAIGLVIHTITNLSPDEIDRIKNAIDMYENKTIDKLVKKQNVAVIIKSFHGQHDLSDAAVDWVIKTALWALRFQQGRLMIRNPPSGDF